MVSGLAWWEAGATLEQRDCDLKATLVDHELCIPDPALAELANGKPGHRAAAALAYQACLLAAQLRDLGKTLDSLARTNSAGLHLASVIAEFDDSNSGVGRALGALQPAAMVAAGELDPDQWLGLSWKLGDGSEELLVLTQAALWANESAAEGVMQPIGSYDRLRRFAYRGAPSDFDSFLLDCFAAGVPFLIGSADTAQQLPDGSSRDRSWFRATLDYVELLGEGLSWHRIFGIDPAVVDIAYTSAPNRSGEADLLLKTPLGLVHLGIESDHRLEVRHRLALGDYYRDPLTVVEREEVKVDEIDDWAFDHLDWAATGIAELVLKQGRIEKKR